MKWIPLAIFSLLIRETHGERAMPELSQVNKRKNYSACVDSLESYRVAQYRKYRNANGAGKKVILRQVRARLEGDLVNHIFPAWYGTPWDFNGVSQKPGEGKIACGYFVSTCLNHAGVKVSRVKLAQQPSQRIIRTFVSKKQTKIMAGKSMKQVRGYLKQAGNGLYIVGLDRHVGFIFVQGNEIRFIHSAYYKPENFVKSEPIEGKNPLSDSKYRVFGKLFSDSMLIKWLRGEAFSVYS